MTEAARQLPGLAEKTRFLLSPASYPDATRRVELVETHMARVFLTDRFAYKMKKPVRTSFLDFSTLDKRHAVCREELRLNRRLTDDVYLDVVPLHLNEQRQLALNGAGTVVEWLVKMRRLPSEASLPERVAHDRLTEDDLIPLLGRLCDFYYLTAEVIPLSAAQYLQQLSAQWQQQRELLLAPELALPADMIERVADTLLEFSQRHGELLGWRAEAGRIVEGHGDLRPEHCFLTDPPQVIDCLEFNRSLRCVDPLDELSYLALECELLGRPDLARAVLEDYCTRSGDCPPPQLSHLYKAHRALLRAHLAAAHLQDGEVAEPDKWRGKTRAYLDAALSYCRELEKCG